MSRIASSSRLDLAHKTYARDLLYFHHGLLLKPQETSRFSTLQHSASGIFAAMNFYEKYGLDCYLNVQGRVWYMNSETCIHFIRSEKMKFGELFIFVSTIPVSGYSRNL
jgi:hypothetical protein